MNFYKVDYLNYKNIKKLFDILFSILLLVILFPLMIFLYFLILFDLKEWPFFIQIRPGYKIRDFPMIKFKTMKSFNQITNLSDDKRMTKISRIIRKLRLDEIPQLLNVLGNQMSFVGPRPLLKKYIKNYKPDYFKRHNVLPGITGLAQISGSEKLPFEERINLDIKYIKKQSFINDFYILFFTLIYVFKIFFVNSNSDSLPKFPD